MRIEFTAREFATAEAAIQWASAAGRGEALTLGGHHYVADQTEVDRLAAAGVEFAYLCDHAMPDGTHRVLTVPIND